ncbi:LamB/YcsF family protein [Polyangium jinanense]|uniref:LamB/YcsF family protein n=1 Tax=Polyangium jinanense TaxID=2829994 RepID=A0A9X4AXD5_9BACT|nr:LamB/YcsF family protein [Polyangium jinanense]MDC3958376.1 LamB/YcsF family protein [Polyangium jinanense]MDC3988294.1 LamB/YcsF family protein [Polyangium jinanense]
MRAVSLNIPVGLRLDEPRELYKFATMASIACGGPGVDERSIKRAIQQAKESWAKIVALVSFPAHGGPIGPSVEPEEVRSVVRDQCTAMLRVAEWQGARIFAVKATDPLLFAATANQRVADAILDGAFEGLSMDVPVIGPFEGPMLDYVRTGGLDYLREAYADRGYRADGSLIPEGEPGAMVESAAAAAENALRLARTSRFDAIGVHGEGPLAVEIAGAVRTALESQGLLSR